MDLVDKVDMMDNVDEMDRGECAGCFAFLTRIAISPVILWRYSGVAVPGLSFPNRSLGTRKTNLPIFSGIQCFLPLCRKSYLLFFRVIRG